MKLSVPSKAFLFGEYAVLLGLPCCVTTFDPRFVYDLEDGLLTDPYNGTGGFGRSSAEFIFDELPKRGNSIVVDWKELWLTYRNRDPNGSGADVISQVLGGTSLIDPERKSAQLCKLSNAFEERFIIFSATHIEGRKVFTHSHLKHWRSSVNIEKLNAALKDLVSDAVRFLKEEDVEKLAKTLLSYGELLNSHGLEHPETTALKKVFLNDPNVLGVKGLGALQADGVLVVVRDANQKRSVLDLAQMNGLKLVSSQLGSGRGLKRHE